MIPRERSRARAVVGVTAALAIALTGASAHAAAKKKPAPKPKPVCHLITDPATDGPPSGDSSLNIISADIASNASAITAVIRVQKLADPDLTAPEGRFYELEFTGSAAQTGHDLYAMVGPAGNT